MKIDLDKFLICDVPEKTIYSKQFGFVTISCYTPTFQVRYYHRDIQATANAYGYGYSDSISPKTTFTFDDLYIAVPKKTIQYRHVLEGYSYRSFSFNKEIKAGEQLVVKNGSGYHRILEDIAVNSVRLVSSVNSKLLFNYLGVKSSGSRSEKGEFYNIAPFTLKNCLETFEWIEDTENHLIDTANINTLKPKTRVFIDTEKGGEGEIVGLKEFNSVERKAIYEVQLYDGTHMDVNWYDKTIKMLVPKSYKTQNELDVLEEALSENKLNPFVRGISNGFNIYWQAVEEAASYTVELYTWNDASAANKLYKIADKTIERNQYYAVFDLLAEGKYFVRIIAEDRTGLKIAVNKAISVDVKKDKPTVVNNDRRGF